MKNKTCGECRSYFECESVFKDDAACEDFMPSAKITVFDRITVNEETLAEEFVDMLRVAGDYRYYSMLTGEFYNSHEEAIAATVAKLKETSDV